MASHGFNCSVACEGIYVDIEWEEESLRKTEDEQKKGDILSRKGFAKMIKEYTAYKKQYVQHFRYDATAESANFGESDFQS